jgi:hypothetical protein
MQDQFSFPAQSTSHTHSQIVPHGQGGAVRTTSAKTADRGNSRDGSAVKRHGILLITALPMGDSLAHRATGDLNPRVARDAEEVSAHLEAESFRIAVLECHPERSDLVQDAIRLHRCLPPEDGTALLGIRVVGEGLLDLLRYTPTASSYAFLSARDHQLRAHVLELLSL